MTSESLKWSAQLKIAPSAQSKRLQGDRITLPQSALEGLLAAAPVVALENGTSRNYTSSFNPFNQYSFAAEQRARNAFADRQQQLPHPLTFRLVNPSNGTVVHAGIREFSAEEGEIGLSPFLSEALGLRTESQQSTRSNTPGADVEMQNVADIKSPSVTVHAKILPKGTYVRLRPLEAGYDAADWKSLLERYLRDNFTTLTNGTLLVVPGGRHEKFKFLVDKFEPEGDAICIVDTDLEVDIEPLNEEQARETLSQRLAKAKRVPGTINGSSTGGWISVDQTITGQIMPGDYVDYELKEWDRGLDLEISVETDEAHDVDVFVSPFSSRQRAKPRLEEHVFADMSTGRPMKRLKLSHTNVNVEEAEYMNISVHAWKDKKASNSEMNMTFPFTISIKRAEKEPNDASDLDNSLDPDEVICKNCKQHVPKRTLPLHEAFCYRNNISCPTCGAVFLKNSEAWKTHWHCPHDDSFGNGELSRYKHDSIFHPSSTISCPACGFEAYNIPILAQHRTSDCPGKDILCQFCHLVVPQQGPDDPLYTEPEVLMSGMTPHEFADGAKTTECHICNKITRLRDMRTHMRLHDRARISQSKPRLCSNSICGRTIKPTDIGRVQKEQLGLCNECFGPLYITAYDPEGKALRRRIERRLLQQLMGGCGKSWCHNSEWCKTGRKNSTGEDRIMTAKDALPVIKPILDRLVKGDVDDLCFCVDEAAQTRRAIADMMAASGEYEFEWCIKALEESHNDLNKAQSWLNDRAPKINEGIQ